MMQKRLFDYQGNGKRCPTCHRDDFKNERGMHVHHKRVHDEKLRDHLKVCEQCGDLYQPENHMAAGSKFCSDGCKWEARRVAREWRVCGQCGDDFEVRVTSDQKFCSKECQNGAHAERTGEDAPNWQGGKVTLTCEVCGDEFDADPHEADGRRVCSTGCWSIPMAEARTGEDAPNWQGGKVPVECGWCGETKRMHRAVKEAHDRHFCSKECNYAWLSEFSSGEGNPAWRGGRFPYGEGWTRAKREAVRESQGRECAGCGAHESDLPVKLSVHHIQRARSFENAEARNDDSNLVALCRSCHNQWEQMSPLRPTIAVAGD